MPLRLLPASRSCAEVAKGGRREPGKPGCCRARQELERLAVLALRLVPPPLIGEGGGRHGPLVCHETAIVHASSELIGALVRSFRQFQLSAMEVGIAQEP